MNKKSRSFFLILLVLIDAAGIFFLLVFPILSKDVPAFSVEKDIELFFGGKITRPVNVPYVPTNKLTAKESELVKKSLLVDLNTANEEELEDLPFIGPKRAAAIVEYRNARGAFNKIEELLEIKGFGEKTLNGLKDKITIRKNSKKEK